MIFVKQNLILLIIIVHDCYQTVKDSLKLYHKLIKMTSMIYMYALEEIKVIIAVSDSIKQKTLFCISGVSSNHFAVYSVIIKIKKN